MKILLIHASWGWGHRRAAEALREALISRGFSAHVADLLDYLPQPFSFLYSTGYSYLVTNVRWLWRFIYEFSDVSSKPYSPARSLWQKWQFHRLHSWITNSGFTHIISTHFITSAILADWKQSGRWKGKLCSVVTDYSAHRYWKKPGVDHFFVGSDEVRRQLIDARIPSDVITISGIPISPSFNGNSSREEARRLWDYTMGDKVILVLTSGLNAAKTREVIQDLKRVQGRFLVSAGKHAPAVERVKEFCGNDARFHIFGYHPRIWEMMKAADVLVSKPGGLTTSEALAVGLPQILFFPIPGQEEGNSRFLVRQGAAIRLERIQGALSTVLTDLLRNDQQLEQMAVAARQLGRPRAAETVIETIFPAKN